MEWQTAKQLAASLPCKSVDHVYANIEPYGGERFGHGPKARIFFPPTDVAIANMRRWRETHGGVATRSARACPGPKPKRARQRNGGPVLKLPVY
jgi:hypothetical protein